MSSWASLLLLALVASVTSAAPLADLQGYYVDPEKVFVSGISAGAYMASQFALAFSSTVHGAGSIAGGPYYCAEGSLTTALTACMSTPSLINVNTLIKKANDSSQSGAIDPINNVAHHRNYIFAGTTDPTVNPGCGKKLEEFYLAFQDPSQLLTEFSMSTGHAQITDNYGSECTTTKSPYINDCNYDAAGILLQFQYQETLKPRTSMVSGNLLAFDQSLYPATSMQSKGYIYVPTGCQQGALCSLHIAFHGCLQNSDNIQVREQYVTYGGYNEWAEANNIIVLYPQATSSVIPSNPNACFDWWGYAGADYATKEGEQMKAIKAMMDKVMSGGPTLPSPTGLTLINVTDNSAIFSWSPVQDASGYHVNRNGVRITESPVSATQYTDTGLSSGTTFQYTVSGVTSAGGMGPESAPLTVKTTGNPPPLTAPTVTVTGTTSSTVSLSWEVLAGASGYVVTRAGGTSKNVTSTTFTDTDLAPETTYTYTVSGLTSAGSVGPDSAPVSATTLSDWVCQEFYDHNYGHVATNRAYTKTGYVYALGSDEYMGLYNVATYTRLAQTSPNYFEIGSC